MHVRTKLILSYTLISALCILLATLMSAVLLWRYQGNVVHQRIEAIAETTAPLLHDNYDPARFDAAQQVARTADQTDTRMVILTANLRDLTAAQGRPAQGAAQRRFTATVTQDTAGLLAPGTQIQLPRRIYEDWQGWQRAQNATPPGAATPGVATPVPLKNAQLTLPAPLTTTQVGTVALREGESLDLALIPLRAQRGAPTGEFRVLIVAEPSGAPRRPLAAIAGQLSKAALVGFLVSLVVALLLARSITRPLLSLTEATRALARGDYSRRVRVRGNDEVAQLGHSFNQMAREIERIRQRERDVLANISHDLKTPLTSIQGFAGALIDGTCPPEEYPTAARIIYDESERMNHLVGDVLQLSRLEAGELVLSLGAVDLHELLTQSARRFGSAAGKAGVTLRVEPPAAGPLRILGDRGRLEQALGNLLDNALRYTPSGGRIDLVGGLVEEDGRPLARLTVRDTGRGIPAEDLPRIFDRFYQADKSRVAGRGGGSGLGLAIVRELIERHSGTIRAESTQGAGTAITILLPLAPPPAPPRADIPERPEAGAAGTARGPLARRT
jgi:signal transduction histidine kinase